jgi:hypothetical protein
MVKHGPKCLEGPISLSMHKWDKESSPSNAGARSAQPAGDATIRWELVHRVRGEIADGTYETPEKLQAALEALLASLE